MLAVFLGLGLLLLSGCDLTPGSAPDLVWGVHGVKPGRLHKPRTAAFDSQRQPVSGGSHRSDPGLRPRRHVSARLEHARLQRRRSERLDDRPIWPVAGRRHSLLSRAGVLAGREDPVPDRRRRARDDAGAIRLSDRRCDRQAPATSMSPSTAKTIAFRSFRPRASGCGSGEATVTSRVSS